MKCYNASYYAWTSREYYKELELVIFANNESEALVHALKHDNSMGIDDWTIDELDESQSVHYIHGKDTH